jgi:hypothetical protein
VSHQLATHGESDVGATSTDARRRVFVGALVPAELQRGLRQQAERNDRSLAAEVRRAVAAYLSQSI